MLFLRASSLIASFQSNLLNNALMRARAFTDISLKGGEKLAGLESGGGVMMRECV